MSNKFQFGSWTLDEVEEAIQDLVRKGLVVDSGLRRWCEETGRYEIVWKLAECADEEQMKAHDDKVIPFMGPTKRIRPRKARTYSLAAARTRRHRRRNGLTHLTIDLR